MARSAGRRKIATVAAAGLLAATACSSTQASKNAGGEIASFTVGGSIQIKSLDPIAGAADQVVMGLVTPTLMNYKTDGTLVPDLATRVTTAADRITFDLRQGTKFSDGAPVTPEDVVFSLKRVVTSQLFSGQFKAVKSITAQGANQVVVSVSPPDATVLPELVVWSQIQEKRRVEAAGAKYGTPSALPVGAGAYKVASFTSTRVTLVPNPTYWGARPKIKSFNYVYVADENTAQLAMRSGDINLYRDDSAQQIKAWLSVPGASATLVPSIKQSFLSLDTTHAPFDDIHVRRAIAYAIDRRGLNNAIYGGHANALKSILSTPQVASVSSKDAARQFLATLPTYDFDITKAKAELAQSRYPNGFSVTLPFASNDPAAQSIAESMQQTMKPLGISVTIKGEPATELYGAVGKMADKGMNFTGFNAAVPLPSNMLPYFIGSSPTAQLWNWANYAPPALDQQMSTVLTSNSTSEQFAATKAILTSATNDLAYVPLFNPDFLVVTSRGFTIAKNVDEDDLFTDALASEITVTP